MDILIKNATKKDAESVAWVIFAALDEYGRASEKNARSMLRIRHIVLIR